MVTIKKIAELAKVSRGTVDRIINERGNYSETAEKKVRKVLKKVDYKPNIIARSLVSKKTITFGVFMPESKQDEKYWELPEFGIKKAEKELGIYKVKIVYFRYNKNSKTSFKNSFDKILNKKNGIDGLLIAPAMSEFTKKEFVKKIPDEIPYVFFDSYVPNTNCISYIGQDSLQSGTLAAKLMNLMICDKGTIGIIRMVPKDYHIDDRIKSFSSYFKGNNKNKINSYEINGTTFDKLLQKMFDENAGLKGIFVPSAGAEKIVDYIKKNKIKRKIYIIGYDLTVRNKSFLRNGDIDFLLSQRPEIQGYEGIMTLFKYVVLKEKVKEMQIIPIDILTKENLKNY
ncbi:MAG: substrate-binding domain-containing protein [Alphaproteobacteria bacterium]